MSTRGIIVFVGNGPYSNPTGIRLYQHCDSYPTHTLPLIRKAISRAKREAKEENGTAFGAGQRYRPTPDVLVGFYIGETTSIYGMTVRIEEHKSVTVDEVSTILGNQGDLEWVYVVDTDARTVRVYGGGYIDETPDRFLEAGTVDPMVYTDALIDEYQAPEGEKIAAAMRSLARIGWPVNREAR